MAPKDIDYRMLSSNSPEARGIVGILRAIRDMQDASGNYDILLAVSVLTNAAGHMLAISSLPEVEIDRLARGMRSGVTGMVADIRRSGGSPLIKAAAVPTVGRA